MAKLSNFEFLKEHDPVFFQLAFAAEQSFSPDPNTTLIKLRQLGEAFAQDMAARCGIEFDEKTTQADLLFKLNREIRLDPNILDLFHTLRVEGNRATHQFRTQHKEALDGLRLARTLAIWFHRALGKQGAAFKPGPFVAPVDPSFPLRELITQIEQLKAKLLDANDRVESNQQLIALVAREKEEYAALAEHMDAEARTFQQLAVAHENQLNDERKAFDARLKAMQTELENRQQLPQQISASIQKATAQLSLNEELTRILIDQQLISAGWEADTGQLTYQKGARPEKGKNKAIAEWPTQGKQAADYVLFAGLTPVAVVEAKRENINVAGKITQAERYSRGFKQSPTMQPAWLIQGRTIAWADNEEGHYQIPFVYSCNARPFVKQLAEQSGTWFRDVRELANLARPLHDFHSPEGLLDSLKRSRQAAQQVLQNEGFAYLKLRDYQQKAIQAVETALANKQSNCLLAMATGTGKTRTIIGLQAVDLIC